MNQQEPKHTRAKYKEHIKQIKYIDAIDELNQLKETLMKYNHRSPEGLYGIQPGDKKETKKILKWKINQLSQKINTLQTQRG